MEVSLRAAPLVGLQDDQESANLEAAIAASLQDSSKSDDTTTSESAAASMALLKVHPFEASIQPIQLV
ncbi:hypothetical protein DM860_008701 [Cuscuta australis]|uniref:Uncharacterized protein n=1 Tax=Cuscuta australis TaxID=267555 RepID=A0A328DAN3_9ASTE|nr:hypothetical protein DM860_008701 [Cuscuta australis]